MTKEEKIIVSAYTGVLMIRFNEVHKYIEKILGRPVWTHELADKNIWDEIREKTEEDFLKICKNGEIKSEPFEPWEEFDTETGNKCFVCPTCGKDVTRMIYNNHFPHYCCECGQALKKPIRYTIYD